MRVESFRVVNYKSFADSGKVYLEPGFNVVVGRNNVGKTALVEALGLRFENKPHRSSRTVPTPGAGPDPNSRVEVTLRLETDELMQVLTDELPEFYVPLVRDSDLQTEALFFEAVSDGLAVEVDYGSGGVLSTRLAYAGPSPPTRYVTFRIDPSKRRPERTVGVTEGSQELSVYLANKFRESLYGFQAVRFGIDEHPIGWAEREGDVMPRFPVEVHHVAPRCLLTLHERANGSSLDGEGIQAWMEWEIEAMRWRVPVEISRKDLEALVNTSEVMLAREKHRLVHSSDWQRWGRRGGLATLKRYGSDWFALLALRRWGRITAAELEAAGPLR